MKYLGKMELIRPCSVVLERLQGESNKNIDEVRRKTKTKYDENCQNLDPKFFSVSPAHVADGRGPPGQRSENARPIQGAKHVENKPFQCSVCWQKFSVVKKLQLHFERTHERKESPRESRIVAEESSAKNECLYE